MSTPATITGAEIGLLSYLFEAVGDLLTDEQRAELTEQLTSLRPAGVAPGDLITAELFNGMINNINDLMARVAVLEGATGGPVITGILPGTGPILTNTTMSILGTGFDVEPNRNTVRMGEAIISQFQPGSNDKRLTFSVPDLFTNLPKSVNAIVETGGKRSNSFAIQLAKAPRAQTGEFDITIFSAPAQTLAVGQTLNFQFDVFADTGLPDEIRYRLDVANAQGANEAAWRSTATFTPTAPHPLAPNDTVRVTMTVVAPTGATRADLILRVLGIDDQAIGVSQPLAWVTGGTFAPSSPLSRIDFAIPGATPPFVIVDNVTVNGVQYDKGINVKVGSQSIINFTLADLRAAHPSAGINAAYSYTTELEANAVGWTIVNPPTPNQHSGVVAGTTRSFAMRLKNDSGAAGATTLFRIYANQTTVSGQLSAFKSYTVIPLILVA